VCARVCVALGIQQAWRMRHIVICGLPGSVIVFHLISQTARFYLKTVTEHKMYVLTLSKTLLVLRRIERDVVKKCILVSI
jgi:hypothetical protein